MLPSTFRSSHSEVGNIVMSELGKYHSDAVSTVHGAVCLMQLSNRVDATSPCLNSTTLLTFLYLLLIMKYNYDLIKDCKR